MTFLTEFFEEFRNVCISHRFIIIDFLMHLKKWNTKCILPMQTVDKIEWKQSKLELLFFLFSVAFTINIFGPSSIVSICGPYCEWIFKPWVLVVVLSEWRLTTWVWLPGPTWWQKRTESWNLSFHCGSPCSYAPQVHLSTLLTKQTKLW